MFGAIGGSVMLLFGLVIVGYTMYTMIAHRPTDTTGWVFSAFYIVGGIFIAWNGYRMLYPPQYSPPGLIGGRRSRR